MKLIVHYLHIDRKLTRISRRISPLLENAMKQIGNVLVKETKRNLSGRLLRKRSGRLFNSIKTETHTRGDTIRTRVWSEDVPYSAIHDRGGRTGRKHRTRIKATRYMSKTVQDKRRQINAILQRQLKRVLK